MIPHLLRCQGFGVAYYSLTLSLSNGTPWTYGILDFYNVRVYSQWSCFLHYQKSCHVLPLSQMVHFEVEFTDSANVGIVFSLRFGRAIGTIIACYWHEYCLMSRARRGLRA